MTQLISEEQKEIEESTRLVTGEFAKWWICFPCWKAYYVPTTGHFGNCPDCGRPTLRWPGDPNQTLRMLEFSTREWLKQQKSLTVDQVKPGDVMTDKPDPKCSRDATIGASYTLGDAERDALLPPERIHWNIRRGGKEGPTMEYVRFDVVTTKVKEEREAERRLTLSIIQQTPATAAGADAFRKRVIEEMYRVAALTEKKEDRSEDEHHCYNKGGAL